MLAKSLLLSGLMSIKMFLNSKVSYGDVIMLGLLHSNNEGDSENVH